MRVFGVFVFLSGVALTWSYLNPPGGVLDSELHYQRLQSQLFPNSEAATAHPLEFSRKILSQRKDATELTRTTLVPSRTQVASATAVGDAATRRVIQSLSISPQMPPTLTMTGAGITSLKPKDASSRYKLVIEIQRQLKSRGCYWGRIDGSWGAGSKFAMSTFLSRVNAKLPSNEPNYILLTLLQSSGDMTCSGCPKGKKLTAGGRCMPPSYFAEAKALPGGPSLSNLSSSDKLGEKDFRSRPLLQPHGRMSIGGPELLPPTSLADNAAHQNGAADAEPNSLTEADVSSVSLKRERRANSARANKTRRRQAKRPDPMRRNLMLSLGGVY
jgi:hypothetical protein